MMKPQILLVEDNAAIASVIGDILQLEGYDVTVARDGLHGAVQAKSGRYRVVILDIMVPGKDGLSILNEIRADERTATVPVIMLTAKADAATTWKGWQAGCDYYMPKPFEPDELVAVVRRLSADQPQQR